MRLLCLLGSILSLALWVSPGLAQTSPTPPELRYTPITPCRAFYLPLADGQTKDFRLAGVNLTAQGGPAAGCGVPSWATAASITLSVVSPDVAGYLTPYAFGAERPPAVLYYPAGANWSASTTTALAGGKLNIFTRKAARIIGDITGYYAPAMHAFIDARGQVTYGSRVVGVEYDPSRRGRYIVEFDRDLTGCVASATVSAEYAGDFTAVASVSGEPKKYVTVYVFGSSGSQFPRDFNVSVAC